MSYDLFERDGLANSSASRSIIHFGPMSSISSPLRSQKCRKSARSPRFILPVYRTSSSGLAGVSDLRFAMSGDSKSWEGIAASIVADTSIINDYSVVVDYATDTIGDIDTKGIGMHKPHRGLTRGNSINGRARKNERRSEAMQRLKKSNRLSVTERLARLPVGGANRQRSRYAGLLAK